MSGAVEWAEIVSAADFRRQPQELDLKTLTAVPSYRDQVLALSRGYSAASYQERTQRESQMAADDPDRARRVLPQTRFVLAQLGGVFAPAGAIGFVLARSRLDLDVIAPWVAVLLTLGATAAAIAVLPLRKSHPPRKNQLFAAVVPAILGVVALSGFALRSSFEGFQGGALVWWWAAGAAVLVTGVIAAATLVVRTLAPPALLADHDGDFQKWRESERAAQSEVNATWITHLRSVWDDLPASDQETLLAELAASAEILTRRGLLASTAAGSSHLPGLLLLESEAPYLLTGERLDPSLQGLPPTR
ncbi:MAG: hypothetical protein ACRCTR_10180 [Actinomycetota bacterium]